MIGFSSSRAALRRVHTSAEHNLLQLIGDAARVSFSGRAFVAGERARCSVAQHPLFPARSRTQRRATALVPWVAVGICLTSCSSDPANRNDGANTLPTRGGGSPSASQSLADTAPNGMITLDSETRLSERADADHAVELPKALRSQLSLIVDASGEGPLSEIVDGAILDHEFVVAEASTSKLHFYELETGRFLRSVGRRGRGPGEYEAIAWMRRSGDSLYVFDRALRRLSVLSQSGGLLRSLQLTDPETGQGLMIVGVLTDGTLLARRQIAESAERSQGRIAPLIELSRVSSAGVRLAAVAEYRGDEVFTAPFGRSGGSVTRAIFGRQAGVAVVDSAVFLLSSHSDTVVRLTPEGARLGVLSVSVSEPRSVTRSDVARARALFVPPRPTEIPFGALFDAQPPPERFPIFGWGGRREIVPLQGASDGTIWLLRYGGVRSANSVWLQFKSSGELVDSLEMPGESLLLDAQGMAVLVSMADETESERVVLLRRRK